MKTIKDFKYTKEHEWIDVTDNSAIIGITDFAQGELGDIIFVELPSPGDQFSKGDSIGTLEAVKTIADIYVPVDCEIVSINSALEDNPELINKNPFNKGWIAEVKVLNLEQCDKLLSLEEYENFIK